MKNCILYKNILKNFKNVLFKRLINKNILFFKEAAKSPLHS